MEEKREIMKKLVPLNGNILIGDCQPPYPITAAGIHLVPDERSPLRYGVVLAIDASKLPDGKDRYHIVAVGNVIVYNSDNAKSLNSEGGNVDYMMSECLTQARLDGFEGILKENGDRLAGTLIQLRQLEAIEKARAAEHQARANGIFSN